jgi:hypothetical protein
MWYASGQLWGLTSLGFYTLSTASISSSSAWSPSLLDDVFFRSAPGVWVFDNGTVFRFGGRKVYRNNEGLFVKLWLQKRNDWNIFFSEFSYSSNNSLSSSSSLPPLRFSMVTWIRNEMLWLYGGQNEPFLLDFFGITTYYNDLWYYNGNKWTERRIPDGGSRPPQLAAAGGLSGPGGHLYMFFGQKNDSRSYSNDI